MEAHDTVLFESQFSNNNSPPRKPTDFANYNPTEYISSNVLRQGNLQ